MKAKYCTDCKFTFRAGVSANTGTVRATLKKWVIAIRLGAVSQQNPPPPEQKSRHRLSKIIIFISLAIIVVDGIVAAILVAMPTLTGPQPALTTQNSSSAASSPGKSPTTATPKPNFPRSDFNAALFSVDDPNSLWVVVNKKRPLRDAATLALPDLVYPPSSLPNPRNTLLRQEAVTALEAMAEAVRSELNTQLVIGSGWRPYDTQASIYQRYVNSSGVEAADRTSARPGYSEHQTGLAIDILDTTSGCSVSGRCFANAPSGKWLAENAYQFGFILRYPEGKTEITGYEFEPWHFRYVGRELATEMHVRGILTLEEFFSLPPSPTY